MSLTCVRRTRCRQIPAAFAAVITALLCSAAAFGQCTLTGTLSTWKDGNSNWNNSANWSPAVVPNSGSTNVCITNGTSTVTLDTSPSIASLQLASGNTLTFNRGTVLSTSGTQILNAGHIVINGGNGSNTLMQLDNNVTLSGGGTLTLSTVASGGNNAIIQQGVAGITLANQSTIQGEGIIGNGGLTLSNTGTIDANSTGGTLINALTLNGGGNVTNTGLLEATNSGMLVIGNTVNNAGGNVTANGLAAAVAVAGTIQGGTLNTLAGGTLETSGTAGLDGTTHGALKLSTGSTYTGPLGTVTNVAGTINNQGNIQVNGGSGSNTLLQLTGSTTLQGGGKVTLSTTASGGNNTIIQQGSGGLILT